MAGCASIAPLLPAKGPQSAPVIAKQTQPGATTGKGAFYMDDGPAADTPVNLDKVPDAVPTVEPLGKFSNRPYSVFGVEYVPQTDLNLPYRQRGIGSWYGRKFHGQKTSSGEIYDMFAMTAAHPTLPIPSYARVTNVKNGQSVIVRVNDRGPFLHSRLIDLSYAAAYRLGYVNNGSTELDVEKLTPSVIDSLARAPVKEEAVTVMAVKPIPDINPVNLPAPDNAVATVTQAATDKGFYVQLGAFGLRENAEGLVRRMSSEPNLQAVPLEITPFKKLFRVLAGPFADRTQAQSTAQKLQGILSFEPLVLQP